MNSVRYLLLHPTLLKTVAVYSVSKGGNCEILLASYFAGIPSGTSHVTPVFSCMC